MTMFEIIETIIQKKVDNNQFPFHAITIEIQNYMIENNIEFDYKEELNKLVLDKKLYWGHSGNYLYFKIKK